MDGARKKKKKVGAQCLIDDVGRTMCRTSKKNQPPFSGSSEQLTPDNDPFLKGGGVVGFALPSASPGLIQGFCTNVQHQSTQKCNKSQASNSHKIRGRRRRSSATDRSPTYRTLQRSGSRQSCTLTKRWLAVSACGPPGAKTHICCV